MSTASPIIGFDNRIDEATLTVGSNSGRADALKDRSLGEAWESVGTDPTGSWIEGTFTSQTSVRLAALFGLNVSTQATYRVRAWSDIAKTDQVVDTGTLDVCPPLTRWKDRNWSRTDLWTGKPPPRLWLRFARKILVPLASSTLIRAFRFDLEDRSNTDGTVRVARPFVGDAIQPAAGLDLGMRVGFRPYFRATEAPDGTLDVSETRTGKVVRGSLSWLTDGERARFIDIFTFSGATGEVVWIPHPNDVASIQRDSMLGIFRQPRDVRRVRNGDQPGAVEVEIQEVM